MRRSGGDGTHPRVFVAPAPTLRLQVEDIMQRRHMKSQPLANGLPRARQTLQLFLCIMHLLCCSHCPKSLFAASALKLFCLAPCDDVPIPWLQQNKSKLGAGVEEVSGHASCASARRLSL